MLRRLNYDIPFLLNDILKTRHSQKQIDLKLFEAPALINRNI